MRKSRPAISATTVLLLALTGCSSAVDAGKLLPPPPPSTASSSSGGGSTALGTNPLDNPDGTKPGLGPITSAQDLAKARELIARVRTAGKGPKTGYERSKFGYAWSDAVDGVPLGRNGCDSRNDMLARDGRKLTHKPGSTCIVTSMTIYDPYTGQTVAWTKEHASKVQIDHVMPLSYDWQMGASHWDETKRKQIANDPLNLLPADGSQNAQKRDYGPASWLPANKAVRCSYAVRFAQVSLKYALPVTTADKKVMLAQCGG
ncbi:HNH endonuclease family protein [Peterkaempfera bronchialis]|uniref:HNH endonuclease n=1 Tax=Peterkaempfera bronchialis TaxID=2126346 RepID=A0A345STC5_9ACTN|nr:HNH endonuclease family protein [Peterkaempfera bronchialis]AXI76980.1 HNH endonuclease [Peterkaempfera bronchialis]